LSIPKDVDKVGFKLFDEGPPARRKSGHPNGSSLVVRSNVSVQPTIRTALALPAPHRSKSVENLVEKHIKVVPNIDDKAVPWDSDEDEDLVPSSKRKISMEAPAHPVVKKVCSLTG
jgi:hypothetical protein